ncbi:OmpA family protein [Burkholderia glumae]|uniref:OmpA family protein n=2 Tax=Burkholderia glumae TaxID=337 RepID=A0AAP9XY54_BURGL|nr:OmpA family protein [Burkholderia glumae]ACR30629.1 Outer membrane protein [Burkholderia glumae BGR1]AJY62683.1 ompA family protein [Burkholderia glumae LMG 2196 = ATCC 33617]KHJ64968.1 membrane protein [Burkholderia glumae]MCM2484081.1 OmpA family protein [Burkholderia glumae]MCM2509771.1 OmpA family protein [Burkholderia glumae]
MRFAQRYRVPLIWLAILAAGLTWLWLPLDGQPSWLAVFGLVLGTAAVAIALSAYERGCTDGSPTLAPALVRSASAAEWPAVMLVVGPHAPLAFARVSGSRRGDDVIWLLVATPDALAGVIDSVRESYQRLPDAVLLPIVADADADEAVLRQEFGRWRRALDESTRYRACSLPCHVAVYASLGHDGDARAAGGEPVWFGYLDAALAGHGGEGAGRQRLMLRHQLDQAWLAAARQAGVARAALGHAVFDWLEHAALLSLVISLANAAPLSLQGMLLADVGPEPRSGHAGVWTQWLTRRTGLHVPIGAPRPDPLPLPGIAAAPREAYGTGVVPRRGVWCNVEFARHERFASPRPMQAALSAVAVTLALSICVSAWQNSLLVRRVSHALDAYRDTPALDIAAKRAAVGALRARFAELERYANQGVPTGLGWGLYRGAPLHEAVRRAIASWRPASGVTLDQLSLFDSGRATLKRDAIPKLRNVLGRILANRDQRVLIAGHTDDVGSPEANLKLSQARALAIRDWFVRVGALPVTRFAIQAYGDTRPIADNLTPQGRAMNRRVEILFIPDPGAHS